MTYYHNRYLIDGIWDDGAFCFKSKREARRIGMRMMRYEDAKEFELWKDSTKLLERHPKERLK
jgi:hypothetical protein